MGEYSYAEGKPGSGVLQVGVNGVAPQTAQKLGLTIEQAQQALDNFREANELGDNTPLPVIITDSGEMYAPLGSKHFGNLLDYVPAETMTSPTVVGNASTQNQSPVGDIPSGPESGGTFGSGPYSRALGRGFLEVSESYPSSAAVKQLQFS